MIAGGALPLPPWAVGVRRRLPSDALSRGLPILLILAVFPVSLVSLFQSLNADTPLAYLGAVPLLALGVAAVQRRAAWSEPTDRDAELDGILATIFLAMAATLLLFEPLRMSAQYWQLRIDLLSLPFFVAGLVTAVYGTRTLWRFRFAILFLFIAWPAPWTSMLGQVLSVDVTGTLQFLHLAAPHLGLATVVPGTDGSIFALGPPGQRFQLSVSAPCAGSNTTLGFLVVGGACTALLEGSRRRKVAWLLCGAVFTWLLNVGRILLIFLVGDHFGQDLAVNLVHPLVGCILLVVGVFLMTLVLRFFGLRFRMSTATPEEPSSSPAPQRPVRPGRRAALLVVALVAIPMAVADAGFTKYSLVSDSLGAARLESFTAHPVQLAGAQLSWTARYDWSKEFFGADSTWNRYTYRTPAWYSPNGDPVYTDAVLTSNFSSLQTYGLEACYNFHGDDISYDQSASLPGGLVALSLVYRLPGATTSWAVVSWAWPVRENGVQRYERVTLTAAGDATQMPALTRVASGIITGQLPAS